MFILKQQMFSNTKDHHFQLWVFPVETPWLVVQVAGLGEIISGTLQFDWLFPLHRILRLRTRSGSWDNCMAISGKTNQHGDVGVTKCEADKRRFGVCGGRLVRKPGNKDVRMMLHSLQI